MPIGGYIISIISAQILRYMQWKNAPQPAMSNNGNPLLKLKKMMSSKYRHLGVYPEAIACNVGRLCSDFSLGEHILR